MDPSPKTKGLRLYPRQWNLELVGAAKLPKKRKENARKRKRLLPVYMYCHFISVFRRISVVDMRKRIKKYAFSCENANGVVRWKQTEAASFASFSLRQKQIPLKTD